MLHPGRHVKIDFELFEYGIYKRRLLENVERVQRGEDPLGIVRDPAKNFPMIQIRRGSTYAGLREGIPESQWGGFATAGVTN